MLTDKQFLLISEVIEAAREGRYMYGNGAMWYIVDTYGKKLCINHVTCEKEFIPSYEGEARKDLHVAESLERWLATEDSVRAQESHMLYHTAKAQVAKHYLAGEVIFTNGNQWYIKPSWSNHVTVIELGVVINNHGQQSAKVYSFGIYQSWKYLRFNGTQSVRIDDSTKRYFGLVA